MRRLKIGIRPQLIVLNLRSERLLVISQLKRTQVQQAIQYIAYQAITVAEIDQVTVPLSKYRAGNNSESVFQDAQDSLLQFVISTDAFVAATLYNLDLEVVAGAANNASLLSLSPRTGLCESIREALNSTSQEDYQTYAILPVFGDPVDGIDNLLINSQTSGDQIIGFQMVFPVPGFTVQPGNIYNINSSSSLKTALSSNSGTATNLKSYSGKTVAIGYSRTPSKTI
ncbi:hypothetical protein Cantr_03537 [Candida viswanathii]|uniref:Uncharacterized protein n=1 Tax=Candida viswanathii TaxID=5486 RepID=A0A367YL71_9ASCO|nr:hypothetical protein Cantr_03537 [Candida viswanathii]